MFIYILILLVYLLLKILWHIIQIVFTHFNEIETSEKLFDLPKTFIFLQPS